MSGKVGILNIGAGDIKLVFDKSNPAESIRAARIVADMLRRGYALLVAVDDGNGGTTYQRVLEFSQDTAEYLIADFDSAQAAKSDVDAEADETGGAPRREPSEAAGPGAPISRGRRTRRLAASESDAIAVARSAGG